MGRGGAETRTTERVEHAYKQKGQRQEGRAAGLTGFDVEGQRVSAVLVGGVAESSDVRADLDTDHTLDSPLSLLLGHRLEDLVHKHKGDDTERWLQS